MADVIVDTVTEMIAVDDGSIAAVLTSTTETVVAVAESLMVIELASQGPPGPQGIQGPSGAAAVYLAATDLSGHIVVTLDEQGHALTADPTVAAHGNSVVGISKNAAVAGSAIEIATADTLTHAGWTFTPGLPVFAGLAGAVTQNPPVAAWQKAIGVARTATTIVIALQPAIFS